MHRVRVLVVEDERKLAQALAAALASEHDDVVVARRGEDGYVRASASHSTFVILDLMMPGRSGLEMLQALRKHHLHTPVLILTARTAWKTACSDSISALTTIWSSRSPPGVATRIRALLRRGRGAEILRFKMSDLEIDVVTRRASRSGRDLDVTSREFELLEYLLRHQGHIVSREMLAEESGRSPGEPHREGEP